VRTKQLAVIFTIGVLVGEVAAAGQRGGLYCTSCGYKESLVIGGTKRPARLTIHCPQCKNFSRKAFAIWEEANKIREFTCPKCSSPRASVYRGGDGIRCPKCGSQKTKLRVRMYFD